MINQRQFKAPGLRWPTEYRMPDETYSDALDISVGGETFERSLRALARGGRLVTCGATTRGEATINLRLVFFKLLSILGSTMGSLAELHQIVKLVEQGRLHPVIDRVMPLAEVAEGHRILEAREAFGKIVFSV